MALLRFLIALLACIGLQASACAVVLVVILMLQFPPISIAVGVTCLLFHWVLRRLPSVV